MTMQLEMKRDLVLVADADSKTARFLSESFAELQLDIAAASSGKEAWKMAVELRPRIIILETEFSDMSGFDLCRKLAAHPKTEHLPFMFYTNRDSEIDVVVGFELGAADYVSKSIGARETALRVNAILKRTAKEGKTQAARIGSLLLDFDQAVALQDGKRLLLSPTEFQILAVLAKAGGRVLSRDEIVSAVWAGGSEVMGRTVDAHVKSLRAKLEDPGFGIVTVRGVGYGIRLGGVGARRMPHTKYKESDPHQDEENLTSMIEQNATCRMDGTR